MTRLREQLSFRRVFLDKAQDLTALQIKFFAAISRRGTVIVGGEQQRLYRFGGSFLRSGVDIRNRSRTLETDHRNTVKIRALSERYRDQVPGLRRSSPRRLFDYRVDGTLARNLGCLGINRLLNCVDVFVKSQNVD